MDIYQEALAVGVEVIEGRVIHKGLVFEHTDDGLLEIKHSRRDFYEPIDESEREVFDNEGFVSGLANHLRNKYTSQLNRTNGMLQSELAYRRNQKRVAYLKETRKNIIEKLSCLKH